MEDTKTRTSVNICGHEYAIAGFESEEYIHRVAISVDRKMSELATQFPSLSTNMLAVLTALNVADESIKLEESSRRLQTELELTREELKRLKIEYALLRDKAEGVKKPQQQSARLFDNIR